MLQAVIKLNDFKKGCLYPSTKPDERSFQILHDEILFCTRPRAHEYGFIQEKKRSNFLVTYAFTCSWLCSSHVKYIRFGIMFRGTSRKLAEETMRVMFTKNKSKAVIGYVD